MLGNGWIAYYPDLALYSRYLHLRDPEIKENGMF